MKHQNIQASIYNWGMKNYMDRIFDEKIIGYSTVKKMLYRIVDTLQHAEKYKERGVSLPHGLLLTGMPGTGKSTLAECFLRASGRASVIFRKDSEQNEFLDEMKKAGYDVISIGKINDIFNTMGITKAIKSKSSVEGMQQTIDIAKENFNGICFTNLVDFDAKWGHRRNPQGYADELKRFDDLLPELQANLRDDDILFITADHGNDPTWKGTDHTREMIPILVYSKSFKNPSDLGTNQSFACIGATIADIFEVEKPKIGTSLLSKLN